MSSLTKLFRRIGLVVAGAAAIVALTVAIVAMISPRIELDTMRSQIEAFAGRALGRPLELQGPLSLRLSLPPAIEAAQIRILNPSGWPNTEFARVKHFSAAVRLAPLLRRQIVFDEINASGTSLSLETAADGRTNWTFSAGGQQTGNGDWKLAAINQLSLRDFVIQFNGRTQRHAIEIRIDELAANAPADDPIRLRMAGNVKDLPFSIDATGEALTELLTADGPFAVKAALALNNVQLQLTGSVTEPLEAREFDAAFQLKGNRVSDISAILDVQLPEIGDYQITGGVSGNPNQLAINGADGHLGKTSISGDLRLARADQRTRIEGTLVANTLDLGPWLTPKAAPALSQPAGEAGASAVVLPEVDLRLDVIEFINLPVEIKDASLNLTLRGDSLRAPLQANIDEVAVEGDIAGPLERYFDLTDLAGRVDALSIRATSSGAERRSLIENLSVSLQARNAVLTYGNKSGEKPIAVDLDRLTFHAPKRQRAKMSADGRLLGEPFTVDLELGALQAVLADKSLPFDLHALGAGSKLILSGQLSGKDSTDDSRLQVQLSGGRFGELAPWLGISPEADASFSLRGELNVPGDRNT